MSADKPGVCSTCGLMLPQVFFCMLPKCGEVNCSVHAMVHAKNHREDVKLLRLALKANRHNSGVVRLH